MDDAPAADDTQDDKPVGMGDDDDQPTSEEVEKKADEKGDAEGCEFC